MLTDKLFLHRQLGKDKIVVEEKRRSVPLFVCLFDSFYFEKEFSFDSLWFLLSNYHLGFCSLADIIPSFFLKKKKKKTFLEVKYCLMEIQGFIWYFILISVAQFCYLLTSAAFQSRFLAIRLDFSPVDIYFVWVMMMV